MMKLNLMGTYNLVWHDISFHLLPEKAIYLPDYTSLLIADPHFGKAAHFRKAGIPVPEEVHQGDYVKIQQLIQGFRPAHLFFLGDLFHSELNSTWGDLESFRELFPEINFHLIKGNHDILPDVIYRSDLWQVHEEAYQLDKMILSHEPLAEIPEGKVNLCGHIHPGLSLYGRGKQKLTLPCYFVSLNQMILPAFGRFTGLARMACGKNEQAFVIADKKVIRVDFQA